MERDIPDRYDRLYPETAPHGCWLWSRSTSGEGSEQQDLLWLPFPVRPGDVLDVAEPFYFDDYRYTDQPFVPLPEFPPDYWSEAFYYRADGDCCEQIPECMCATEGKPTWRPASEMPDWAIRHHPTAASVGAKMLGQIDTLDALAMRFEGRLVEGVLKEAGKPERRGVFADGAPEDEFRADWTADHGEWQPERWVWTIERGATT